MRLLNPRSKTPSLLNPYFTAYKLAPFLFVNYMCNFFIRRGLILNHTLLKISHRSMTPLLSFILTPTTKSAPSPLPVNSCQSLHYTSVNCGQCAYSVHFKVYVVSTVKYTVSTVHYTVSTLHYTVATVQYIVSTVQYTVTTVQYTVSTL